MKRIGWIAAGMASVVALLAVFLVIAGSLHERRIARRPPLSLQDLDRLAVGLNGPRKKEAHSPRVREQATEPREAPTESGRNEVPPSSGAAPVSPATAASTAYPRRLNRCASAAEKAARWGHKNEAGKIAAVFAASALRMVDGALFVAGSGRGMPWERAQVMLQLGDWAAAHRSFSDSLETSKHPEVRRDACAYLAWLEDDPELAVRYMELACSDPDDLRGGTLAICEELARLTGSVALADDLRARLQEVVQRRGAGAPRK